MLFSISLISIHLIVFIVLDLLALWLARRNPTPLLTEMRYDNFSRVVMTFLWPFTIPMFLGIELVCLLCRQIPKLYRVSLKKIEDLVG